MNAEKYLPRKNDRTWAGAHILTILSIVVIVVGGLRWGFAMENRSINNEKAVAGVVKVVECLAGIKTIQAVQGNDIDSIKKTLQDIKTALADISRDNRVYREK